MKRTKKIALIITTLMLMVVCFAFGVSAERAIVDSGECGAEGDNVTWVLYDDGEFVVSGEGDMKDYVRYVKNEDESGTDNLGQPYYGNEIKRVTILEGVTSIGSGLFQYNYDTIESLVVPESVKRIGRNAFSGCDSLVDITLPNRALYIGNGAFANTGYYNADNHWKNDVLYIGNHIIKSKDSISGDCSIEEGTLSIAEQAFLGSLNLLSVSIPKEIEIIGDDAFKACYGLNSIIVDSRNENYSSDEYGVLYNKEKTELIKYPSNCSEKNYSMPNTVRIIKPSAFEYSYNLVNVNISEEVISIGEYAFQGSMKIENVNFPQNLEKIGYQSFNSCVGLKVISIPENVKHIGKDAFSDTVNESIYVKSMNTVFSKYPIFESVFTISGISNNDFADLCRSLQISGDLEIQEELLKYITFFDEYTYTYTGTIYCHTGSTAEAYAIENGVDYELIHFYEGEWTYDYDDMIRTRKCIHCDELEIEPLESTETGDVEIIEPVDPDTDFEVDEIEKNSDNYIIIDGAINNGVDGEYAIVKAFDITMKNKDGVHVQPDGTIKVKLPNDWSKKGVYKVYRVNDDGTLTDMNSYRQGSHLVFETDHFSIYVIVVEGEGVADNEPETPEIPEEPDTTDCGCICHKSGWIYEFLTIIFKFVAKIGGMFQICDCGIAHY